MSLKKQHKFDTYVGKTNKMVGGLEVGYDKMVCVQVGKCWVNLTNKEALKLAKKLKKYVKAVKKQDKLL